MRTYMIKMMMRPTRKTGLGSKESHQSLLTSFRLVYLSSQSMSHNQARVEVFQAQTPVSRSSKHVATKDSRQGAFVRLMMRSWSSRRRLRRARTTRLSGRKIVAPLMTRSRRFALRRALSSGWQNSLEWCTRIRTQVLKSGPPSHALLLTVSSSRRGSRRFRAFKKTRNQKCLQRTCLSWCITQCLQPWPSSSYRTQPTASRKSRVSTLTRRTCPCQPRPRLPSHLNTTISNQP